MQPLNCTKGTASMNLACPKTTVTFSSRRWMQPAGTLKSLSNNNSTIHCWMPREQCKVVRAHSHVLWRSLAAFSTRTSHNCREMTANDHHCVFVIDMWSVSSSDNTCQIVVASLDLTWNANCRYSKGTNSGPVSPRVELHRVVFF